MTFPPASRIDGAGSSAPAPPARGATGGVTRRRLVPRSAAAGRGQQDHRRHHARHVPERAGADHRRPGPADHRGPSRRHREPVLGGHGLSPERDGGDAAVRQAVRHLWPAQHPADRRDHLHPRFGRLRAGAHHVGADRGARAAGHRRRRHPADRPDHHRRPGVAARTAALSELYGGHVHGRERHRPGAGRRAHRPRALVAHLLDQRADGRGRARHDLSRAGTAAAPRAPAQARYRRRRPDGRRGDRARCWR